MLWPGTIPRKNKGLNSRIGRKSFDTMGVDPYYTRPMSQARHSNADTRVDAVLRAMRGGEVQLQFLLADLPRLDAQPGDETSRARLRVRFSKIDNRVMVDGDVDATLRMRCQRCLQPVSVAVEDTFNVIIVASEEELNTLSEVQDAIVADATRLDLAWLAEEQLLLAAPLVPVHASADECGMRGRDANLEITGGVDNARKSEFGEAADDDLKTQRPFAALREMMKKS